MQGIFIGNCVHHVSENNRFAPDDGHKTRRKLKMPGSICSLEENEDRCATTAAPHSGLRHCFPLDMPETQKLWKPADYRHLDKFFDHDGSEQTRPVNSLATQSAKLHDVSNFPS